MRHVKNENDDAVSAFFCSHYPMINTCAADLGLSYPSHEFR